jgi:hypothetical protein
MLAKDEARRIAINVARLSAPYRSGPSRDWIKMKNADGPAMIRAREAEW